MSTRTLDVTLPSDVIYVSGTVNGVDCTWTNTEGNTWETEAERTAKDVYVVALTMINSIGTSSTQTLTLYYGLHLITDRTRADVTRVQTLTAKIRAGTATASEVEEYLTDLKGSYNPSDMNRVGAAMLYVRDLLEDCGYSAHIDPKVDFVDDSVQTPSQMDHYLEDLRTLRGVIAVYGSTPEVPETMRKLGFQSANDIEKILMDIDEIISKMKAAFRHSGVTISGIRGVIA
jgi:hypothetical protein